jgi:hypothetical protein
MSKFLNTLVYVVGVVYVTGFIWLTTGCSNKSAPQPIPPPTIRVTIHENIEAVWVEVSYSYHGVDPASNKKLYWTTLNFNSLEELEAYEEQVKFLLLKLDEIQEKMLSKQATKEPEQSND